ncbi:LXG domain-containing protein [Bacillus sp. CGMCC 1.16541]|uniref:LXG domain-containing protein n=1 Tax=Bacillus sp. CGMCC 1.16541 TaxID=2185143 RepID=UPI000D72C16B|nr:LXG domain-containing protein [Bacillus sp. CGMCC 1.16541]
MKVLDVSSLHASLEETMQAIDEKVESLEVIEASIVELINSNDSFNGKGAEAIKLFYQSCHQPFLLKLKQVLTSYKSKLFVCKNGLSSLEPDERGFIRQEFLQGELINKLIEIQNYTNDVTMDANRLISSILDIVPLEQLDDTMFNEQVLQAKHTVNDTVSHLDSFDLQNTSSFNELTGDLQLLSTYIEEMGSKVSTNPRALEQFSPLQVFMSPAHASLLASIRSTPMYFFTDGTIPANKSTQSIYALNSHATSPYHWLGLDFAPSGISAEKKVEPAPTYLAGETVENGDFTFSAGAGKVENDWSGLDGDGQLGGSSTLTGIHTGVQHDTAVIDSSFSQDIGKAEAQASIGGKSVLPLVKAGGTVYGAEVRSQVDKDVNYVGRTGVEAKGEILKAGAYAGVDNSSIGFGAKAAVAEGEISGIIPIPFTDYNIKGTAGASAFGAGGEAKIGKETMIDLRLLIGVKLGISFEKE